MFACRTAMQFVSGMSIPSTSPWKLTGPSFHSNWPSYSRATGVPSGSVPSAHLTEKPKFALPPTVVADGIHPPPVAL